MRQVAGGIQGTISQDWYYRLKGDWAKIYQGKNRDSDYLEDDRRGLFSRSDNAADRGSAFDVSVAIGYPFYCYGDRLQLIPLVGYSRSEQRLRLRKGFQTFDLFFNEVGPFSGLNSRYETKWSSVWLGVDFEYDAPCNFTLYGGLEYHYAFYLASGHWNLRPDFVGPFHHDANANGAEFVLGANYNVWNCLGIGVELGYKYYRSENGVDKTKFTFIDFDDEGNLIFVEDVGKGRLNPVTWRSFYIEGNLSYDF
jgi:Protochlamydia outer membrane protein